MKLRLSDDLSLPLDFITQTAAILAIRGAGKSNLAAVIAEQMFAAKLPFVVIDPTGTWSGLRAAGTGPGLAIVIFGGRDADVPLERGAGAMIADLIAEQRLSCVVDVSEFSEGDKVRFLTDFAKRLYAKNRDPLHLFLEEADDYVPQKPFREQAECLRAFQDIVRRGRARGLGLTMVTQRSAVISKDVLTQIETLFVLRTTSPQDRKAIEAWVDYHGQSRELVDSLPSLKPGEAWVWSPHYLGTVKRIQANRRSTLDTAATPKDLHGKRTPSTKADVDLEAVRAKMAETIERARADDPKELRKQLAAVRAELAAAKKAAPAAEVRTVELNVVSSAAIAKLEKAVAAFERTVERADTHHHRASEVYDLMDDAAETVRNVFGELQAAIATAKAPSPAPRVEALRQFEQADQVRRTMRAVERPRPVSKDANGQLTGPEQRIIDALAWWEVVGLADVENAAAAFKARYSPTSSSYTNPRGALASRGLLEYPAADRVRLTAAGRALSQSPSFAPTSAELHRQVIAILSGPEVRILQPLIDAFPRALTNAQCAAAANYSETSSSYTNPRGHLRSIGLIEYPGSDLLRARSILFLEGEEARS